MSMPIKKDLIKGQPVPGFTIDFQWQKAWEPIFNEQIKLLKLDIHRARAEDRVIVYLSCPISSRGGGYHGTNVDIARHTQRRLMDLWGHRFWILNPAQYQLESKEGTGLINSHIETIRGRDKYFVDPRDSGSYPKGGDYMRMWTKVLVENEKIEDDKLRDKPLGLYFDAYYFIGPNDVRNFFTRGGAFTVTAGVEEYFARKHSMDPDFRDYYSINRIEWDRERERNVPASKEYNSELIQQSELRDIWEDLRKQFFRFYSVRASANFSLGCHDEWNIFCEINKQRLKATKDLERCPSGNVGDLLAGYFDDKQIDPGAAAHIVSKGYAL